MRTMLAVLCLLLLAPAALAQMPGAAPGPEHGAYEALVGRWTGELSLSVPGMEASGTSTVHQSTKKALGGFWYVSDFDGVMMGTPFEGHSVAGYDPETGKYIESWVDNMHPQMARLEGSWDPQAKTFTKFLDSRNPMTGERVVERHQTIVEGPDAYRMTMAQPGPDGEYVVFLTIRFQRDK